MGLRLHMQMEQSSQRHLKFGDDVIVGVLDTGICSCPCSPAHPVFAVFLFFLHFVDNNLEKMVSRYSSRKLLEIIN